MAGEPAHGQGFGGIGALPGELRKPGADGSGNDRERRRGCVFGFPQKRGRIAEHDDDRAVGEGGRASRRVGEGAARGSSRTAKATRRARPALLRGGGGAGGGGW